jgi:Flp pilus assembly pilin Flp
MTQAIAELNVTKAIRGIHEDEDGMEAMQVVIIVAVAALVLLALYKVFWPTIKTWVTQVLSDTTGMDFTK